MSNNADQPAYPVVNNNDDSGPYSTGGCTKKERLAMEIYAIRCSERMMTDAGLREETNYSLRAADIFFEQLEKNSKV